MKLWQRTALVLVATIAAACAQSSTAPTSSDGVAAGDQSIAPQGLRLEATVNFGMMTGSPFPPGEHDRSFTSADSLVPQTVVIDRGGTVTFETFGVHQVAIYEPGIEPDDIDVTALTSGCVPVPVPLIDDPDGRVEVLGDQPCAAGPTAPSYTFDTPGRYLVICTFLPHFTQAKMYGWVVVRNRPSA